MSWRHRSCATRSRPPPWETRWPCEPPLGRGALEDIRAAISRCIAYRDHLDSAELGSMAYDAVLRNLAVIGEAVKSLPDDFKQEHAGTPWPSIAGLRNVVVHEYFRVNPDMIRDIVDNQLAPLLDDIG